MKNILPIFVLSPLLLFAQREFSQDRLTIDEIAFSATYSKQGMVAKLDSILRAKKFSPDQSGNKNFPIYTNEDGDLYYIGYSPTTNTQMTLLSITEFEYYLSLKNIIITKYKKIKTDKFENYNVADFYDGGNVTFVTG